MNIEDYRDYCLSLGDDVEERMRELTLNSYNLVREKYHRKYKSRTLNQ